MGSLGISGLAHLFGVLAFILLLVWLLHYREGIEYDSDNGFRVFNVHPLLMYSGFIFLAGEGMMAFQTIPSERRVRKFVHMALHLIAIILGVVGLCAVFKFHDMSHIPHLYTLHSWIGIATFCFFGLQWLFGFGVFMLQGASPATRAKVLPWHKVFGRALLFLAVCAAETGLMEKHSFLQLKPYQRESYLVNFTGLAILLFGAFVNFSIVIS
ncbi:probable transmembrane ascorbate ferrireductase 3 [Cajanus cajan]|uniref:Cytochrome b reductase 1 n=1 Tax=Cajanus cajan TaxID=3821 RepID=A0A151RH42_CAJCA|nr:probable transmembrane ascorbate ferrireductase 3 [Cajanus cajan]KYP41942.1 Cytochrome b reductase 1 [Cajanus cajan]